MVLKKKAVMITASMLTKMIWVLLAGVILFSIVYILFSDSSDIETAIAVCRTSVDAREFSARNTKGIGRSAVPMLCKSIDIEIPEKQYDEIAAVNYSKAVMMNIADRAMDCWYMFGEGMYDKNIFSGWGFFSKNQCFACFIFTVKDKEGYTGVSYEDFENFVSYEYYKPIPRHKPFCLFDAEDERDCVSRDAPECERKGGICIPRGDSLPGLELYEGWSCNSRRNVCNVYTEMLETYLDYMFNRAFGLFTVDPSFFDLEDSALEIQGGGQVPAVNTVGFTSGKTYGIGFISHTRDIGITISAAVVGTGLIVLTGGKAGVIAMGAKKLAAGAVLSGAAGTAGEDAFLSFLNLRAPPTIYISSDKGLDKKCNVVGDFNQ